MFSSLSSSRSVVVVVLCLLLIVSNVNATTTAILCQNEFELEIEKFEGIVYISLALTAINYVLSLFLARIFISNPLCAMYYYFIMGLIKVCLGLLLFTIFLPTCPQECYCDNYQPPYFYPMIVLIIGTLWIVRGIKFLHLVNNPNSSSSIANNNSGITISMNSQQQQHIPVSTVDDDDEKDGIIEFSDNPPMKSKNSSTQEGSEKQEIV